MSKPRVTLRIISKEQKIENKCEEKCCSKTTIVENKCEKSCCSDKTMEKDSNSPTERILEDIENRCKGKEGHCYNQFVSGTMCQECWDDLFENTKINYPKCVEKVKNLFNLAKNPSRLFITRNSHMIDMWDFNKNIENIETIRYGVSKEIHFKCLKGHEFSGPLKDKIRNIYKCDDCRKKKPIPQNDGKIIKNKCKNGECLNEIASGTMCLSCWEGLYDLTMENYPEYIETVRGLFDLASETTKNLFIKNGSEMIKLWNFYKNTENIETITYSSAKNIHFKCLDCDEKFESFDCMSKKTGRKFKCEVCKNKPKIKEEPVKIEKIVIENQCQGKNYTCTNTADSGTLCRECWENLFEIIEVRYPEFLTIVKQCFQIALETEENLFIKTKSELIQYWNFDKNTEDIRQIKKRSQKHIEFKCFEGHECCPSLGNKSRYKFTCVECIENSDRKKERAKMRDEHKNNKNKVNPIKIGDESEEYIRNMLEKTGFYSKVERLGNMGGNADIKVTLHDGREFYIQVKTLGVKDDLRGKQRFGLNNDKKGYDDNMLMVCVSNDRKHFVACFFEEIKHHKKTMTFSFGAKKSKYDKMMFRNEISLNAFIKENIDKSSKENRFTDQQKLEIECMERLQNICEQFGLTFERQSTNGDAVDCIINGHTVQLKYRSFFEVKTKFGTKKASGTLSDGSAIERAYDKGDFKFLILEYGGTRKEPDIYKGNFLILSELELIKNKIITNGDVEGKMNINIYPHNSKKIEWYAEYWNKFDQLL